MAIDLPPFSKIYKQREGADKFFYDKIAEVVEVVNALTAAKKGKVNISVKDDNEDGVAGATVTLTSGSDVFTSGETGSAGGSSINNVPYGVYSVAVTAPEGYNTLASYDDVTVNSDTTSLNLTVNKKVVYTGSTETLEEEPGGL
ncbi:MAG: carboxypeptidase-like regulatory domain-containing protein [Methanobrevibacter sp.]|nr:carboxypeptidase-like regulatory domain-containing protein [Methanobrevibacter sp.]